jgi:hypothetical protein
MVPEGNKGPSAPRDKAAPWMTRKLQPKNRRSGGPKNKVPLRAAGGMTASKGDSRDTIVNSHGGTMKNFAVVLLLSFLAVPVFAQGAPPQASADQPYTMEYYYKVQWGHQQEFLQLFLKNHYPLLKKEVELGRMLSVKIETPANHMTEDSRWDYRVTLKFKNSTVATTSNPDEESQIKQLWPDQETYKREEQRRFEILLAHWDLPVSDVTPKK